MEASQVRISLTAFIHFISVAGPQRETIVKATKKPEENAYDYYKALREKIVSIHKSNKSRKDLESYAKNIRCDSDHYGGFKYLIENDVDIKKFWIHDPYQHVDVDDVKYVQKDGILRDRLNAAYAFKDGTSLLDLLDDYSIDREEVFTGDTYNPLNIEVLGPDLDYYESLIPDFRVDLEFKEEPDDDYEDTRYFSEQRKNELYSQALEDANDDPSSVN